METALVYRGYIGIKEKKLEVEKPLCNATNCDSPGLTV